MSRLPTPGQDAGSWGNILNDYLSQVHKSDGTLKDNIVGAAQLKTDAVTTTQLADDSVTNAQIADNAVTTASVADGAITAAKLGSDVVMGGAPADGSITTAKLANDAVTNAKVDSATRASLAKADSAAQPGHTHVISDITNLQTTLDGKQAAGSYVTTARTVNGKALSSDITLNPSDIGAATAAQGAKADSAVQPGSLATVATSGSYADLTNKPSLGNASSLNVGTTTGTVAAGDDARITGAVPSTRTVAGKPLSADVTLTPADIGAATAAQGSLANTAVQPTQLATNTKKIAGLAYFAVSSRSFPALVRPPEPSRGKVVIRNVGTNNVNVVAANRTSANYNSPGWTGSTAVAAGKELVADASESDFFIGPDADGTLIKVKVYAEVGF